MCFCGISLPLPCPRADEPLRLSQAPSPGAALARGDRVRAEVKTKVIRRNPLCPQQLEEYSDADHGLTFFPTFSQFLGRDLPGLLPRRGRSPGEAPSLDSWLRSISDSFEYPSPEREPLLPSLHCVPWHPLPQQTGFLKLAAGGSRVAAPILATTVQLSAKVCLGTLIQKFSFLCSFRLW